VASIFLVIATLVSALPPGVAFSHLLEIPGKRRMPAEYGVAIQKDLYTGYRVPAAPVELGATLSAVSQPCSPGVMRRSSA